MKYIGEHPTDEMYRTGLELDVSCARCGSSVATEHCDYCEDGYDGHDCGEDCCMCLHPEENVICQYCRGSGVWHTCLSSPEWCEANPAPGREDVKRGQLEWFTIRDET